MQHARLRVASFTANESLAYRKPDVISELDKIAADVLVIPTAFRSNTPSAQDILQRMGQFAHVASYPYDTSEHAYNLVMLGNKEKVRRIEKIELFAGQFALRACLDDVDVIGVDLTGSDTIRCEQATGLLRQRDPSKYTIAAGNFHSVDPDSWNAKLIRLLTIARTEKLASLHTIAEGRALKILEDAGYCNADQDHQETWGALQVDHIMVPERVEAIGFGVLPMHDVSRHPVIVADLVW